jgi:release factor glutamine methyltransferase
MSFDVNESVLIPRPETEELVRWIAESAKKIRTPSILDIGTGSGCIPISLARALPEAKLHALDISLQALKTAQKNAKRLQVRVDFFEHDILSRDRLNQTYDIMISNPPYVRRSEISQMRGNVVHHEPEIALFVSDDDPLEFFRKIVEHGQISLRKGGLLFFEINEFLGDKTAELLSGLGYSDIVLKKDMFEKDRMIRAVKK